MPQAGPAKTIAARAGGYLVACGGPVTLGNGASATAKRFADLAATELGLRPWVSATATATIANGLMTMVTNVINDKSLNHNDVSIVMLCGGLQDDIANLATIQSKMHDAIRDTRKAFTNARIVVCAGVGCITDTSENASQNRATVLAAMTTMGNQQDCLTLNLAAICGTDPNLQASGINPNDAGHQALANAIVDAIHDDTPEPIDTPITPARVYKSGLTDWASRQVEDTRRREAEKREANRPTGTELGGVTAKLDQLTQAQGVQQVLLDQQQDALEKQQNELERQQNELEQHQGQLESQQKAIKAAQDQLKKQQDQLTVIVGDQGNTITNVKQLAERIDAQQKQISSQAQQLIDMENWRTGALLQTLADYEARISALEGR